MALIVFLRGINVGGHRTLRPGLLAAELAEYDVVNIGAAGTFIVRKPGPRTAFVAELRRKLPFQADIAFCSSSSLIRLQVENPFGSKPAAADVIRFVGILSEAGRPDIVLPADIPAGDGWSVRVFGSRGQLVFGVYRRHMKTIACLGRMDELFGAPVTVCSWTTVQRVLKKLREYGQSA